MKFGVVLPHRHTYASTESITSMATEANELGYDSLWVTDHVLVPSRLADVRGKTFYEALTTLAYVGGQNDDMELGTCVLAASAREPILLARQVATLDALIGGGVVLGVGTGWIEEELEATTGRWEDRGAYLDESIEVMRSLWTEKGPIDFAGDYTAFQDMLFSPKPARDVPVYVGGMQPPSLRRAAEYGDGWLPWAVSPSELAEGLDTIEELGGAVEAGCMSPADVGTSSPELETYTGTFGERHHVVAGSVDEVLDTTNRFAEAGLDHFTLSFRDIRVFKDDNIDTMRSQMRLFAEEVMPSFH